jgi:4'-phosphopantetheinyl transferase
VAFFRPPQPSGAVELESGAPPDGGPSGDELHLRLIDLRPAAGAEMQLRRLLSPDEIARAAGFQLEQTRLRFVVVRGLLRQILARALTAAPAQLEFAYGAHGKPALGGRHTGAGLEFSVSHSGDYALIGLAMRRAIGVDIEQLRPMPDFAGMAAGYFSDAEMRALDTFAETERLRAFFRCWTRKEAFMKATGEGMGIALDSFSVELGAGDETRLSAGGDWTVRGLALDRACEAAVAVAGRPGAIRAWHHPVPP